MRKELFKIFVILCCCVGLTSVSVNAQSGTSFEIDIPFEFVVKDKNFPADKYKIGRFSRANPDILILKNTDGKKKIIFLIQRLSDAAPKRQSELTFYRFGNIYFLHSILESGESTGSQLVPGASERGQQRRAKEAQIVRLTVK